MSDEIAKYGTFFASDFQSEPTTTDSGIELDAHIDKFYKNYKKGGLIAPEFVLALIERLRIAEAARDVLKAAMDASREIHMDVVATLQVDVSALTTERDELKESLRTTRLEQAAKAFQVDDLETQVERLTAERDHLLRAGMAVETKINDGDQLWDEGYAAGVKSMEEQVERLTAQLAAIESRPE